MPETETDYELHGSPAVNLDAPWTDERGMIQPLVDRPMRAASLITSKAGSIRGNHYHKTDWHYCYLLSGRMEYYERPVGSDEKPTKLVFHPGQMVYSKPMTEHAMKFLEDSVWICLFRNCRHQEDYEADTVRVPLIK